VIRLKKTVKCTKLSSPFLNTEQFQPRLIKFTTLIFHQLFSKWTTNSLPVPLTLFSICQISQYTEINGERSDSIDNETTISISWPTQMNMKGCWSNLIQKF